MWLLYVDITLYRPSPDHDYLCIINLLKDPSVQRPSLSIPGELHLGTEGRWA